MYRLLYPKQIFVIIKRKIKWDGIGVKYGIWKIAVPEESAVAKLCAAGYSPLTARVLCSRGFDTPEKAAALLDTNAPLNDPFAMKEMDRAVAAVRAALEKNEKIAVFGDYDVDGITATCLLTDYLRSVGADCIAHIPGRLEEGYGLNIGAIEQLYDEGVRTIITVDCGITALEEAELCVRRGITLVITDHHECKDELPRAAAVIDPHRADRTYPHTNLSGVGIAFKLAAALSADQDAIARRYCDLFCLGTIADVMPLCGENRHLVAMGLAALQNPKRIGVRALIQACGCDAQQITASTIGYVLAPRINAAGRMEHAELAVQLFLSKDEAEAKELSETLCRLNRERQSTEYEIYREATSRLRGGKRMNDSAIVLAGENWHQGVVGIVASRLSEEYGRPTFLICLSGDHGKASSRSYGGFNLFASLTELSDLLEDYGGHELAAGFTIMRNNIDEFRRRICRRAEAFNASGQARSALEIDCEVTANLLTEENVDGLSQLEPCGTGCPKPVFCLSEMIIERIGTVGNGKHLRLRLRSLDGTELNAIYFSGGNLVKKLCIGDRIDVAFHLQINDYRGVRTVQLSLIGLRKVYPAALFDRYMEREPLTPAEKAMIAPDRSDVADVWRYLRAHVPPGRTLYCDLMELCLGIATLSENRHSIRRTLSCLEILQELGFVTYIREHTALKITLCLSSAPNPLENSQLYHSLRGE